MNTVVNTKEVVLTKDQAAALEELKKVQNNRYTRLVKEKLGDGWFSEKFKAANSIPFDDFITALYKGYTVKLTPEEEKDMKFVIVASDQNSENKRNSYSDWDNGYDCGWRKGVNFVLSYYGKKEIRF